MSPSLPGFDPVVVGGGPGGAYAAWRAQTGACGSGSPLPPDPAQRCVLQLIAPGSVVLPKPDGQQLIRPVTGQRVMKLFLTFATPWWTALAPPITAGSSSTDLPLGQCWYFTATAGGDSLLMASYNDTLATSYWEGLESGPRFPTQAPDAPAPWLAQAASQARGPARAAVLRAAPPGVGRHPPSGRVGRAGRSMFVLAAGVAEVLVPDALSRAAAAQADTRLREVPDTHAAPLSRPAQIAARVRALFRLQGVVGPVDSRCASSPYSASGSRVEGMP